MCVLSEHRKGPVVVLGERVVGTDDCGERVREAFYAAKRQVAKAVSPAGLVLVDRPPALGTDNSGWLDELTNGERRLKASWDTFYEGAHGVYADLEATASAELASHKAVLLRVTITPQTAWSSTEPDVPTGSVEALRACLDAPSEATTPTRTETAPVA